MNTTTWDGTSYCTNKDGNPATIRNLLGMYHDTPIYELICHQCALQQHTTNHPT